MFTEYRKAPRNEAEPVIEKRVQINSEKVQKIIDVVNAGVFDQITGDNNPTITINGNLITISISFLHEHAGDSWSLDEQLTFDRENLSSGNYYVRGTGVLERSSESMTQQKLNEEADKFLNEFVRLTKELSENLPPDYTRPAMRVKILDKLKKNDFTPIHPNASGLDKDLVHWIHTGNVGEHATPKETLGFLIEVAQALPFDAFNGISREATMFVDALRTNLFDAVQDVGAEKASGINAPGQFESVEETPRSVMRAEIMSRLNVGNLTGIENPQFGLDRDILRWILTSSESESGQSNEVIRFLFDAIQLFKSANLIESPIKVRNNVKDIFTKYLVEFLAETRRS